MTSLESLPYDIKFLILQASADFDSAISLSVASRPFNRVLRDHRKTLLIEVLATEASDYQPESFWLAYYAEKLANGSHSSESVRDIYDNYVRGARSISGISPPEYEIGRTSGKEIKYTIARNHKLMRDHCNEFVSAEMYPRLILGRYHTRENIAAYIQKGPPVSTKERRRIISAFYRVWVLKCLYYVKIDIGDIDTPCYGQHCAAYLREWDYWQFEQMRTVLGYLKLRTESITKQFRKDAKFMSKLVPICETLSRNRYFEG
ncbi:hypothetical protein ABW19_dt0206433 [Dactylella cylindrospora]|nr:hypothetical protein ABW19_dt0206433 [Dactylella cylindrospora]